MARGMDGQSVSGRTQPLIGLRFDRKIFLHDGRSAIPSAMRLPPTMVAVRGERLGASILLVPFRRSEQTFLISSGALRARLSLLLLLKGDYHQ